MRQKHNLFTEVGFARPGPSVDKKFSLVLATMCSNTRIEIMIKHGHHHLKQTKQEAN